MPDRIDIYSASWGPTDDGKTVDGPRNATMKAIVEGVNKVGGGVWKRRGGWEVFKRGGVVGRCLKEGGWLGDVCKRGGGWEMFVRGRWLRDVWKRGVVGRCL